MSKAREFREWTYAHLPSHYDNETGKLVTADFHVIEYSAFEESERERKEAEDLLEEAYLALGGSISEMVCLGNDLDEINSGARSYPTALLCPDTLEECQQVLAKLQARRKENK